MAHNIVQCVRKRLNLASKCTANGSPRLHTGTDARHIERLMRNRGTKTPKQAARALNKNVSEWTVGRALLRIGLVSAVKQKKPALSNNNVKARLQFCKAYGSRNVEDWKRVIWYDETKIIAFSQMQKNIFGIVHMKIFNVI